MQLMATAISTARWRWVFDQTPVTKMTATINVIQNPQFTVTKEADIKKIDEPGTITYTIRIENTGNLSLSKISISDPLLEDLDGPEDDAETPGVLDVGETWIYTGTYKATQEVIDSNGVDANNVIDGDGDIDSTVIVSFAESDIPQTAYAAVKTDVRITGDIFEKDTAIFTGFCLPTGLLPPTSTKRTIMWRIAGQPF